MRLISTDEPSMPRLMTMQHKAWIRAPCGEQKENTGDILHRKKKKSIQMHNGYETSVCVDLSCTSAMYIMMRCPWQGVDGWSPNITGQVTWGHGHCMSFYEIMSYANETSGKMTQHETTSIWCEGSIKTLHHHETDAWLSKLEYHGAWSGAGMKEIALAGALCGTAAPWESKMVQKIIMLHPYGTHKETDGNGRTMTNRPQVIFGTDTKTF